MEEEFQGYDIATEVLFTDTLPSTVYQEEIAKYLQNYACEKNFPVKSVKFKKKMDGYVGFSLDYYIIAKRLPPIPGGWEVQVHKFIPQQRKVVVAVKLDKDEKPVPTFKYLLKMIDEYTKEGLKIYATDEIVNLYGAKGQFYVAEGHPLLLDEFEQVVEEMR